MDRRLIRLLPLLALSLAGGGCEQREAVMRVVPDRVLHDPDATVVARIDASVLAAPEAEAEPVGTVLEGDLLTVLAEKGEFSQVNVRATGTNGWIDSNLCLYIPPNPYWEGDTNKAREVARKIYQDKFLVQRDEAGKVRFPINRVKVETAFNTVTFFADGGTPKPQLPRKDAEALAEHWIGRVAGLFQEWKDPTVYVKGFDGQSDYLLTMGSDKTPHWL